ncbi:HVA22-like protein i [Triticum dicoccoides]|uniref:HVA22-like protein i n=1 Tax=Triticum dicoccoides TaxID=85692 RepID=UPI001890945B|nr:HVA22-like protein i [Triticum dicoccoides]
MQKHDLGILLLTAFAVFFSLQFLGDYDFGFADPFDLKYYYKAERIRLDFVLWVLVAMPMVIERFMDWTVSGLPMYEEAKLLLVIYLWQPSTRVSMVFRFQGAGHVYDGFLHPLVAWHEADIDRGLLELRARARDVTASQLKATATIGQVWLVEAARCVSSQLQDVRSGREGATH